MVGGRPNLMYSPGPGLWSLVLGPFGPDLGPDLGPGPGPELDNIKAAWSDLILVLLTLGCCCCQPWLPGDRTQNSLYAPRLLIF